MVSALITVVVVAIAVSAVALAFNHRLRRVEAETFPVDADLSVLNDVLAGIGGPAFGDSGTVGCAGRFMAQRLWDRVRQGRIIIDRMDTCSPPVPEFVAYHLVKDPRTGHVPWWPWALTSEVLYYFAPQDLLVSASSAYLVEDRGWDELALEETGRSLTDLNEDEILWMIARQDAKEECDARQARDIVQVPGTRSCSELALDGYELLRGYLAKSRAWRAEHGVKY